MFGYSGSKHSAGKKQEDVSLVLPCKGSSQQGEVWVLNEQEFPGWLFNGWSVLGNMV